MTVQEVYLFLAIIMQLGHDQKNTLKDYWYTHTNHFTCPFMGTLLNMTVFHVLRFFHFCESRKGPGKADDNYDHLSKMRAVSYKLIDSYSKYCSPPEHLEVDEIMVVFKARVIFKHNIHTALVFALVTFLKKLG